MALVRPEKIDAAPADTPAPLPRDAEAESRLLASPAAAERRSAARGLASTEAGAALLVAHLAAEPAVSVRGAILNALIDNRSPAIAGALTAYLSVEDTALRSAVVDALLAMPDEVEPLLGTLLSSDDSDLRILAVNIASKMAHRHAPALLQRVIETDGHLNVCAAAVDGLTEIGDHRAVAPLEALADRFAGEPFIAFAVEVALRRIRAS